MGPRITTVQLYSPVVAIRVSIQLYSSACKYIMLYILLIDLDSCMEFWIPGCAEIYQTSLGGVIYAVDLSGSLAWCTDQAVRSMASQSQLLATQPSRSRAVLRHSDHRLVDLVQSCGPGWYMDHALAWTYPGLPNLVWLKNLALCALHKNFCARLRLN